MPKVIVNPAGSPSAEKVAQLKKEVADLLGILEEDVLIIPGATLTFVEVPAAMTKARADKDAHDKAEADKLAKENEKLEKDAIKAAADAAAVVAKADREAIAIAEARQKSADAKAAAEFKAETEAKAKADAEAKTAAAKSHAKDK